MKYRRLDSDYDYVFGHGSADFYIDNVESVAQALLTRLRLIENEWFLDLREGLKLYSAIIGRNTTPLYDPAIKQRILGTPGVTRLVRYESILDNNVRNLAVTAAVDTTFGMLGFQAGFGTANERLLITESGLLIVTEDGRTISVGAQS